MNDTDPDCPEDPNWNGRCTECNKTETPMWRVGPSGYKTLCNACGIRWRRLSGDPIPHSTPSIKISEPKNIFAKQMPLQTRQPHQARSLPDRFINRTQNHRRTSPPTSRIPHVIVTTTDEIMEGGDGEDQSDNEEWSPFPNQMKPSSVSATQNIYAAPKYDCSSSPFTREMKIEKTIAKSPPVIAHLPQVEQIRSAPTDIALLREILCRLENLRKEHKKTTKQVEYIMEECKANPELFLLPY